jgi:hypothetical protein
MCQEDIGFQDISIGAEKTFQPSWLRGTGFHFVFLLEFGYSTAFPESWRNVEKVFLQAVQKCPDARPPQS